MTYKEALMHAIKIGQRMAAAYHKDAVRCRDQGKDEMACLYQRWGAEYAGMHLALRGVTEESA